jgi:D-alanyl-D-alanine carboxypeptidase (penicillin-binding protein 5/6)
LTVASSRPGGSAAGRIFLLVTVLAALLTATFAVGAHAGRPPNLDAKAWTVIDARTGEELAGSKQDRHLPMASTTKLMTAYLAIRSLPMTEKLTAGDYDAIPGESLMGLEAGQRVSVRDLLYGLIMLSGNDAAVTLAEAVSGSEKKFVKKMNATAVKLGLNDTHYDNPIGLDGENHYSSARDLASLGRTLMQMPRFRPIAGSRTAKLRSYDPPLEIETINHFVLDNAWAKGIKTGHTTKAGYVLTSDGRRRATELIGAVIGTPTEESRDVETVKLLDYGFSLYKKDVPVKLGKPVVDIPVKYNDEDLALVSSRPVRIGLRKGETAVVIPDVPSEVEGPIAQDTRIGRATVTVNGDLIASVPLFSATAVKKPTVIDKLVDDVLLLVVALVLLVFAILGLMVLVRHRRQSSTRKRLRRVTRRTR